MSFKKSIVQEHKLIEILNKLKSKGFLASTYQFSTLYITLSQNLIRERLNELIKQTFNNEGSFLGGNEKHT